MKARERVATNFIDRYGVEALERLLSGFGAGESHQVLADELGVSRERVRQWRNLFGTTVTLYNVRPEVQRYLR